MYNFITTFILSFSMVEAVSQICRSQLITSIFDLLYLLFFTLVSRYIVEKVRNFIRKKSK